MAGWIAFYVSGFVAMAILIILANRGVNVKRIKFSAVMKTLLACFGSWITVFIVALKEVTD